MQRLLKACLVSLVGVSLHPVLAITDFQPVTLPFTQDLNLLRASLTLPVTDHLEKIVIPQKKLKTRAFNPKKDQTIEPISLTVPRSETGLVDLSNRLAAAGKTHELQDMLLDRMKKLGPTTKPTVKILALVRLELSAIIYHLLCGVIQNATKSATGSGF